MSSSPSKGGGPPSSASIVVTPLVVVSGSSHPSKEMVEQFKSELRNAIEGVKLIKKCILASQSGQLNNQMALEAVKIIVQLHQNLFRVATQYSALGETVHSKRMLAFINNTIKQTVLQLGNGLKILLKSNDTSSLDKYTPELVTHIRHLFTLLKEDSSIEELVPAAPSPSSKTLTSNTLLPPRRASRVSSSSSTSRNSRISRTKVRSSRIAMSPAEIQEKELERIKQTLVKPNSDQKSTGGNPIISVPNYSRSQTSLPVVPQQIDEEIDNEEKQSAEIKSAEPTLSSFIGCYSDPGDRYGDTNQDTLMCCKSGQGFILGIFDGHGANGEIASQIASQTFKDYFSSFDFFSLDKKKQHEAMREVFQMAHKNIIKEYQKEKLKKIHWNGVNFQLKEEDGLLVYYNRKYGMLLQDFGTTAVVAAVKSVSGRATQLLVANVGDSIAIIGRTVEGEFEAQEDLCFVHNGHSSSELERISQFGCTMVEDNYIAAPEESGFHWAQLAVTRSLGHKYFSKYGVIPDPHISSYNLHQDDKYLILTSDGVTDVLSGQEVIEVVGWHDHYSEGNMQAVAKELVKYSLRNWDEEADNTTAIVIKLK